MESPLNTRERKKEFDGLFNRKIIPFFEKHGFHRYSKTTKRVFKAFPEQLSVFIFFEYKTFGSGFYDISIAWYDAELGTVEEDAYLAIAQIRRPSIKGDTVSALHASTDEWMEKMESSVLPFIEAHSTHAAILHSGQFYFPKPREEQCRELLKRKSAE